MGLTYITSKEFDEYKKLKRQESEQSQLGEIERLLDKLSHIIERCGIMAEYLNDFLYEGKVFSREITKRLPFYDDFLKANEIPFEEMSVLLQNSLKGNGIKYWMDITSKTKRDVSLLRTMGKKRMAELCAIMDKYSIKFKAIK